MNSVSKWSEFLIFVSMPIQSSHMDSEICRVGNFPGRDCTVTFVIELPSNPESGSTLMKTAINQASIDSKSVAENPPRFNRNSASTQVGRSSLDGLSFQIF